MKNEEEKEEQEEETDREEEDLIARAFSQDFFSVFDCADLHHHIQ